MLEKDPLYLFQFRQSNLTGRPEQMLHFTLPETLQIAISESFTNTYQRLLSKVKADRAKILYK